MLSEVFRALAVTGLGEVFEPPIARINLPPTSSSPTPGSGRMPNRISAFEKRSDRRATGFPSKGILVAALAPVSFAS